MKPHHSYTKIIKKKKKKHTQKENYSSISLMNIDAKNPQHNIANQIQYSIKRIIHHDQVDFIPRTRIFQYLQINQYSTPY